ncbi:MAG TPA: AI-2E family transporter [Burkholderiaceae bacterium]|nr:AI-2E family transporter [Burkholderiaceae bacterium]
MKTHFSDRLLIATSLVLLTTGCVLVLWPFITSLLWAAILVSTCWPAFARLDRWLGHRRIWSASLMTLLVMLVLLGPVVSLAVALSDDAAQLGQTAIAVMQEGLPNPPDWLARIPLVGQALLDYWQQFVHNGQRLAEELAKWSQPAQNLAFASGRTIARGVVDMGLSVFIAFFLFLHGEVLARRMTVALEHLSGTRAHYLIGLTRNTVTGVIVGVLGTALAQGFLAALGFLIAGVPGAVLLGALTFCLSVVPVGPPLIWGGAAIWLFQQDQPWWAVFVAAWGFFLVSTVDNIIKPFIISRGSQLPFLIVFLGVLGGVLAFGVIGVFLGPAMLAIGFRLTTEWTADSATQKLP